MKTKITIEKSDAPVAAPVVVSDPARSKTRKRLLQALCALAGASLLSVAIGEQFEEELSRYIPETVTNASSYNKKPSGGAALFELCEKTNLKPVRWQKPYRELKNAGTLVLIAPAYPPREFEVDQILNWVAKGNRLAYLDYFGLQTGKRFLNRLSVGATDSVSLVNKDVKPEPLLLMEHVQTLNLTAEARLRYTGANAGDTDNLKDKDQDKNQSKGKDRQAGEPENRTSVEPSKGAVVLAKDDNGGLIIEVPYGKGSCFLSSAPNLCCNRRVADSQSKGNFQLVSNWLSDKPGTVYFDEKCQGVNESISLVAWLCKGKMGAVLAQITLLFAVALVSLNQRFGPPRNVSGPRRISNLEFVTGMAHTYRKARANDTAWAILFSSFKTRLCKSLGVSPADSTKDLANAWSEATGLKHAELQVFLDRAIATESTHITREEMLELVARCDHLADQSKEHLSIARSHRQGS